MVDPNNSHLPNEIDNELDEGWWASVLSETAKSSPSGSTAYASSPIQPESINWQFIQEIYHRDEIITLTVTSFNRGGLLVQSKEVQGFVPTSHLVEVPANIPEEERQKKLEEYIGRALQLKVIECEPAQERVVFSERSAKAGEGRRKELFSSLKVNDIVEGIVTNITEFGIFIDLGGVEGLIHVSEISWGRVLNINNILQLNQKIKALVLQINEKTGRVALSIKQLQPNPWKELAQNHQQSKTLQATVSSISRFGVFAQLENGLEGLIHISSLPIKQDQLQFYFPPGLNIRVKILHIDVDRRRLGLSLLDNPPSPPLPRTGSGK